MADNRILDEENSFKAVTKINATSIIKASFYLSTITILVCYIISVAQGHVEPWLPMISDCFVYPPSSYISRFGMTASALLLALNQLLIYFYLRSSRGGRQSGSSISYWVGGLGALGLCGVAAVNEDENGLIHGISAGFFFVGQLLMMSFQTGRSFKLVLHGSSSMRLRNVRYKLTLTVVAIILGLAFAYFSTNWGKYHIEIAICEWLAVFIILLFNMSFISEMGDNVYLGEIFQALPSQPMPQFYAAKQQQFRDNRYVTAQLTQTV